MEDQRHRREMEENYLWRNPCSYNDTISGGTYTPKMAKNVAQQAKQAYEQAVAYKEKVAKWHSFDSYDSLLKEWRDNWLKKFPWFTTELPLPDDQYAVEEYLPELYKALKMVVAGLHKLSQSLEADGINEDNELAGHISNTMKDVRAVLCYFFDLMIARNLEMMPVYDSEVPEIDKSNKLEIGLYIYRDTIDYLQYLSTVFQKMSESSQ